jgi:hypothetical protein
MKRPLFPVIKNRSSLSKRNAALIFSLFFLFNLAVRASNLDTVGVTLLRTVATNVDGAGIRVAQAEANNGDNGSTNSWEVNPANVTKPVGLFTYASSRGTSTSYPNSVGDWSSHADAVGNDFYGLPNGVATNVAHIDNYEAGYFYNSIIATLVPPNINDRVVNQSFNITGSSQQTYDSAYDNYAAQYGTLFVSGVGNGGAVNPPATCYNGIGVGAYGPGAASSTGPTQDNGRAKPDIVSPGAPINFTSFSTPYVAGAAAVLMQAALRGDGGNDTNSAADIRKIKSLLLNGAIKPADWTNNAPSPLDTRYGAGVLNVFNSYEQLAGGKHGYIVSTSAASGRAHPPTGNSGTISVLSGWDFNTNSSGLTTDSMNHYFFNVTNNSADAAFTLTATLVWNRQQNQSAINNLDLFLYNCASSNLVACSTSLVDNVQHIWLPQLPQGRYDLQVWKAAGTPGATIVSSSETYALAWEFFSPSLNIALSGTNIALEFPVYPAGFFVEDTTNLTSPIVWETNDIPPPVVMNNQNHILLGATNAGEFFRLLRP